MIVVSPAQMREADERASSAGGGVALMRRAGERIAAVCERYARGSRIAAFAGTGNNGGDAFAALALLRGYDRVIYAQPARTLSPARADAESRAAHAEVKRCSFPQSVDEARDAAGAADLIVIGLAGTGARLPLTGAYADLVRAVNESGVPCIAIDVPPGVDGESGAVSDPALRPCATVTLGALKSGLLLCSDRRCVGELWLGEIGMPPESFDGMDGSMAALDDEEFLALLPTRPSGADKRSAGAPLILAGSQQFPGAAVLCAMGAARAGAGYVTAVAPESAQNALRHHLVEQVVVGIRDDASAESAIAEILDISKRSTALAIGPGLGLDERTGEIVTGVIAGTSLPVVADASALFHFAKRLDALRGKPIVVTPHEGEFARLSGKGSVAPGTRTQRLTEFVSRTGITTLLKGERTLIYDGATMHVNTTGTPALATAGTGDVLTGVIGTLLAQGLSPVDAARAGAYWHGLAGRHAANLRPRGVIARDVCEALPFSLPAHGGHRTLTRVL